MYECYFCKLCEALHENHHLMMKVACLNKVSLHFTSWEQYTRFIQFKSMKDPRDYLMLDIREDVLCFDSISESLSG